MRKVWIGLKPFSPFFTNTKALPNICSLFFFSDTEREREKESEKAEGRLEENAAEMKVVWEENNIKTQKERRERERRKGMKEKRKGVKEMNKEEERERCLGSEKMEEKGNDACGPAQKI